MLHITNQYMLHELTISLPLSQLLASYLLANLQNLNLYSLCSYKYHHAVFLASYIISPLHKFPLLDVAIVTELMVDLSSVNRILIKCLRIHPSMQ